ncbi:16S rRNA (guanine(966)-N(2))-methyltransferase RsmD [Novosphingobium sp. 1949]|uniref:16S rRNA (Guanine(966)-N(2))-methyltransferase RsmD n=1 Tax=Novosphingobium organovorum TaxID=2930092 RepID=A0ABT0BC10_9SPHN|nr:16S rRNA (guanine(966)-N(2))-methyltransferase RsmD [Novosphingobium organovorum]MCJ2182592.1 16S rRNA (guanine(966)-N(2))-methyltransferase RsmD [Novosphingobium organovorum]
MKPANTRTGLRIVAGEWRGRKLLTPEGDATRPTADRTRETLFSMLASRLGSFEGLRVADLFAGSGALGLEALSRGAAHCLFVDQDASAIRAIRGNIANLKAQDRCDVRAASALALGTAREALDLVMLDPPYETGAGAVAADKLARLGWINEATWVSIETARSEGVSLRGFELEATRDVGKARLHILRLA